MSNKSYRHHAYCCYINYIHGYLGRKHRRVIPACVVNYIRDKWPDPEGKYVGFTYGDEDDDAPGVQVLPDELESLITDC